MLKTEGALEIEGRTIAVSKLDKVLYPKCGFTKADVINYYIQIAPLLLPHLRDRAVTLKRYPEGVEGDFFYEKNCPSHRPAWVKTLPIWSESSHRTVNYCLINDLPTLVWTANLAALELHTSLGVAPSPERPTMMVYDLDPGPPADTVQCCEVAILLHEQLARDGLESFPKTSGSKGLQLYVPLNHRAVTFDQTKAYAKALAERLTRDWPERIIDRMEKRLREGKIFIDWSQNDERKTTISVYSLRAKELPTVSTPVTWPEIAACLKKRDATMLRFTAADVLQRVEKTGDLFKPLLEKVQKLPAISKP